jgi:hypothetical protein
MAPPPFIEKTSIPFSPHIRKKPGCGFVRKNLDFSEPD